MRFLTRALALCLLAGTLAAHASAQRTTGIKICPDQKVLADGCVSTTYDRFEGQNTVNLKLLPVDGSEQKIYLTFAANFKTDSPPPLAVVSISSFSPYGYLYPINSPLDVLINNSSRLHFNLIHIANEPIDDWFAQSFSAAVHGADLTALAAGNKVEMRIGKTEFALTDAAAANLRKYITVLWGK